jgi:hypothetical protein
MQIASRPFIRLAPFLLCLLVFVAITARAQAYVYWTNLGSDSIGRAMLDGSLVDQNFLGAPEPLLNPCGVAVDGEYVYWANMAGSAPQGKIGRAKLDGSEVDNELVKGAENPCGIAVNATHVFWANGGVSGTTIGRARLDGTEAQHDFITGLNRPQSVAVDAQYVYWTELGPIGRAKLNGTEKEIGFITTGSPASIAVDGTHIYWTDVNDGIGRANLDSSEAEENFIEEAGSDTEGIAVDGSHVYWTNEITDTVARANLDRSSVELSFIQGGANPTGVAVDSLPPLIPISSPGPPPTSHQLRLLRVVRNRKRGTAKLIVQVSGPGTLRLAASRKVKGAVRKPKAAGKVKLALNPKRRTKVQLQKKGRVRVLAKVTFTTPQGDSLVKRWRRALVLNLPRR